MNISCDMIRRNYRFLLKWLLLLGTSAIVFKLCCDKLVQVVLYIGSSSLIDADISEVIFNYEESLIAWAATGQRTHPTKSTTKGLDQRDDLQLIGAQVFFRHGARTPLRLLPTLEEAVYGKDHLEQYPPTKWDIKLIRKIGNTIVGEKKISSANDVGADGMTALKSVEGLRAVTGQLTAVGQKQLYQLGRQLRFELIDNGQQALVPATYDPKHVYCRSTFMNRTVASARSFLAGLFSSDENDPKIQAKGPFEIEVHHFHDEDMFPNPRVYPVLLKCLSASSLYQSLADDHALKQARKAFLHRIGQMNYTEGITELYDDIVSRQAHNFPVPQDLLDLATEFEVMSAREFVYRATSIGFDSFIRSTVGALLYLMRENFQSILANYIEGKSTHTDKPYQKLFIYSGHDTTIIPLAMALEIFNMRWPKYAASIVIKYFVSRTDSNKAYVTISYAGEPQLLPNCPDYHCPYRTFLNNLRDRFEAPKIPVAS